MAEWRISLKRVRELAQAKGLSIWELSRQTGIARNTIKRYWRDDRSLTSLDVHVLVNLCLTLECTPGDLLILEKITDEYQ